MKRHTLSYLIAVAMVSTVMPGASQTEVLRQSDAPPNAMWLDSLDLGRMVQRRGAPKAGAYAGGNAKDPARPLSLNGVVYPHGIGTLSINELIVDLKGQATRFV